MDLFGGTESAETCRVKAVNYKYGSRLSRLNGLERVVCHWLAVIDHAGTTLAIFATALTHAVPLSE